MFAEPVRVVLFGPIYDSFACVGVEGDARTVVVRVVSSIPVSAMFEGCYYISINSIGVGVYIKSFISASDVMLFKIVLQCFLNKIPEC